MKELLSRDNGAPPLRGKGALTCPKCQRKFATAAGAGEHLQQKHGLAIVQTQVGYKGLVPMYDNALVEKRT